MGYRKFMILSLSVLARHLQLREKYIDGIVKQGRKK